MRYLIITDIHANLDALEAVLRASDDIGYDRLLVLGDLVGYGAQPNEVVERVRSLQPFAIIRGNHDKVASGAEDSDGFNPIAQQAAAWTYRTLTPGNRAYLAGCPAGPLVVDPDIEICHGSPGDEDAYITSELGALRALKQAQARVCFYGHTHVPVVFRLTGTKFDVLGDSTLTLDAGSRYLINPGSVGQPRDGDARAAFAVYDAAERRVGLYRVEYPVDSAQNKIVDAGLPSALARRLALGR